MPFNDECRAMENHCILIDINKQLLLFDSHFSTKYFLLGLSGGRGFPMLITQLIFLGIPWAQQA